MASSSTDPARSLALKLLSGVAEGRMLEEVSGPAAPEIRARAQRLAAETLRQQPRADTVLKPLIAPSTPPQIRALLRLAIVEHFALGAPAHAVVDDAVSLAKVVAGRNFSGLVNAVLRNAMEFDRWRALAVPRLPDWLRKPLRAAEGEKGVAAIEAAHLAGAPIDITLRPDADPSALIEMGALVLEGGSLRLPAGVRVSALPGYAEGAFWVQDAAAAQPARILLDGLAPASRVLDLCAAPGGKTLQLAAAGHKVTAVDISARRLERLHANLARTKLSADVIAADLLEWSPEAKFDAILLDAPCSATGTIRRHPELPWLKSSSDLSALSALQAELLDRALAMLAPKGRLVLCTCSLLPAEGEDLVAAALARHEGLQARPITAPIGQASGHGWRSRPSDLASEGGVDGFFIAELIQA